MVIAGVGAWDHSRPATSIKERRSLSAERLPYLPSLWLRHVGTPEFLAKAAWSLVVLVAAHASQRPVESLRPTVASM
jgi:hypothetical protein